MPEMICFRRRFKELGLVLVMLSASRYSARLFQNLQRGKKLLGSLEKQAAFEGIGRRSLEDAIGVEVISCRFRIELSSPELG